MSKTSKVLPVAGQPAAVCVQNLLRTSLHKSDLNLLSATQNKAIQHAGMDTKLTKRVTISLSEGDFLELGSKARTEHRDRGELAGIWVRERLQAEREVAAMRADSAAMAPEVIK